MHLLLFVNGAVFIINRIFNKIIKSELLYVDLEYNNAGLLTLTSILFNCWLISVMTHTSLASPTISLEEKTNHLQHRSTAMSIGLFSVFLKVAKQQIFRWRFLKGSYALLKESRKQVSIPFALLINYAILKHYTVYHINIWHWPLVIMGSQMPVE